jgi:hypothetical protein
MSDFDFLSITKSKLVLFLSVTLSLALIISLVMILAFTCQQKPIASKKNMKNSQETTRIASITVNDFLFEDHPLDIKEPKYYLFRERMKQWTQEQVHQFFIPQEEILRNYFEKKNDNRVKEFFESIK